MFETSYHRERPVDDILVDGRNYRNIKLECNDEKEGLCFKLNAYLKTRIRAFKAPITQEIRIFQFACSATELVFCCPWFHSVLFYVVVGMFTRIKSRKGRCIARLCCLNIW